MTRIDLRESRGRFESVDALETALDAWHQA
jgi:hypothetical protein